MSATLAAVLQIALLVAVLAAVYRPLIDYMYISVTSPRHLRVEKALHRLGGVDPDAQQRWPFYAVSLLAFSAVSVLFLYALMRLQSSFPLSLGYDDVAPDGAWNTAVSFVTNTNWQWYVAMTGDGTNDAPTLAQANVGVAMNTGTSAAKEAGNMVDLDSDPTKLLDIVEIGKQLLITRGALTTFSIANDIAKFFAIIPAMFTVALPGLDALNIMRLSSPESAILSTVIFNAIIIALLIPLAVGGVRYVPRGASELLRRNLLVYGLGGIVAPFLGIKLIDLVVSLFPAF